MKNPYKLTRHCLSSLIINVKPFRLCYTHLFIFITFIMKFLEYERRDLCLTILISMSFVYTTFYTEPLYVNPPFQIQ